MTKQLYTHYGWGEFVKVDKQEQRLADAAPQMLEALEVAQQFDLSPTFDAKATYTRRKAEEWRGIKAQISVAIRAAEVLEK